MRVEKGSAIDNIEVKSADGDDVLVVEGYASTFGNVDHGGDVVCAGAFKKSLDTIGLPMLLWQHKMDEPPIGSVIEAKEDAKGLWYKAEIPKDSDPLIKRIVGGLKRRAIKSNSIGYKTAKSERRKSDGARMLRELKLYEISIVNMPMNPEASVDRVKGLVAFHALPLIKATAWDAEAAQKRIAKRFGTDADADMAYLFADPEAKTRDPRLLIADVDEAGQLYANPIALFKAAAAVCSDLGLDEEAVDGIKAHLDRYYALMNLESPVTSISVFEYDALTEREREARLKSLGISQSLAKKLAGLRDAGRTQRRDDAVLDELRSITASLREAAATINS